MSIKVKELKQDEFYIIENNPRHPHNPNGLVLKYMYTREMDNYFTKENLTLYIFEITMVPDLGEDQSWRFRLGEQYAIMKSELEFMKKL